MPDDALSDEAALWFARMRGPDAETERPAFEAWLTERAAHREAYNWIAEVFSLGRLVEIEPDPLPTVQPVPSRLLQAALVAALVLLMGVGGWAVLMHRPDSAVSMASQPVMSGRGLIITKVGQIRAVRLADGSRITLDTDSAVSFTYRRDIRRLELVRGRARFDVAHEGRPFVVAAGRGTVTAHGTVFDVGLAPGGAVTVRLLRGSVDVALPVSGIVRSSASATTRRLTPGQQVAFSTSILPPAQAVVTPDDRWPEGVLDCDGMALADLVARANRYTRTQIVLADPDLGRLKVSGAFRIDAPQLLAERVATVFGLHADAEGDARIVLERGSPAE
ncbi:FecR family protein [Sphingomonas glacialis]|nr:FecR domain-containing protein [Sphingomonas glacialis]